MRLARKITVIGASTMKLLRSSVSLVLFASVAIAAFGQSNYARGRNRSNVIPPNPQALATMQVDLTNAIEAMKVALPIYDGDRVKSIHEAHEALLIVDQAKDGINAIVRVKPNPKDNVTSASAHSKYTKDQIVSSQTTMRKAYKLLQQAWKDLQLASGSKPNKKAVSAANHLLAAGTEANKAIAIHAAQG
jgi:hypothetical protein